MSSLSINTYFKPSAALLLLALGVACGDGDTVNEPRLTRDSGSDRDGAGDGEDDGDEDGGTGSRDAGGGGALDGAAADGGSKSEAGSTSDGGRVDAGATLLFAAPVELRTAGTFAILAKSGISTVPTTAVTGNLGVSPAAESYITGFSLIADATTVFSTSSQVTGKVYAADQASPTPANLTTAVADMELAFTDAAGRAADFTELGAGNIGGMTLAPGVYKWGTGLLIPTNLTLSGGSTAVWIFQVAEDLTISSGTKVLLTGGALAKNIFWQVSGAAELSSTAHCEGSLISKTSITLGTSASINGRLLAQTAVTLAMSTVVTP
jgi:hypothetical protein